MELANIEYISKYTIMQNEYLIDRTIGKVIYKNNALLQEEYYIKKTFQNNNIKIDLNKINSFNMGMSSSIKIDSKIELS